jgi:hypothetical protein
MTVDTDQIGVAVSKDREEDIVAALDEAVAGHLVGEVQMVNPPLREQ